MSSLSTENVAENGSWKQRADAENADRSEPKQHYRPETVWGGRRDPECPTSYTDSPRRQHDICFHFLDIALHSTSRGSGADIWREWNTEMILNQFFLQKKIPWKARSFHRGLSERKQSYLTYKGASIIRLCRFLSNIGPQTQVRPMMLQKCALVWHLD